MSLFTSLNTGLSALNAQMAALQTIGHNVANANTPGFTRQRPELVTQVPEDLVFAQLGRGVRLATIRRAVDQSLALRLQTATASLGDLRVRERTLRQLEGLIDALSDNDLGGSLDRFFSAIEELAKRPEDGSTRRAVLAEAQTLSESLSFLTGRIRDARKALDAEVPETVDQVNRIAGEIASLNEQVLAQENGGLDFGAANDLRDRRELLMQQLSELVSVKAIETPRGELNVLAGSEFLVFGNRSYALSTKTSTDRGVTITTPVFEGSGIELPLLGGRLKGVVDSRDLVLVDFFDDLNELGHSLIFEFNRVHAQGEGLTRLRQATSANALSGTPMPTVAGAVTGAVSTTVFTDAGLIGGPDLTGRTVQFLTGANALQQRRIAAFNPATGQITLGAALGAVPALGDAFEVITPAPLAVAGVVTGNTSNTGFVDASLIGFPDLAGQNVVFRAGPNRLQERRITSFDSTTGTINFDRPFDTPVRVGDAFQVTSLPFPVVNGGFDVVVRDEATGAETITHVDIDLDKLLPDATLPSLRAQLDAIANLSATITPDNRLHIETTSGNLTFHFANDTSGVIAALGLNAMFAGQDGTTMAVNPDLLRDPSLLAAGRSAAPGDGTNALAMSALRDALVVAEGTLTFEDFYHGVVGALGIDTQAAADRVESQQLQLDQLSNERQRVSGVNIDEEVVHMITFQRAFQASARFIGVIDTLLQTLLGV